MSQHHFVLTTDFGWDGVSPISTVIAESQLNAEILASAIGRLADFILADSDTDDVLIQFTPDLTGPETVTLAAVVAAHVPAPATPEDPTTQQFLTDGSRPMTGDIDVGTFNVINVGLVDGVDVSVHALSVIEQLSTGRIEFAGFTQLGGLNLRVGAGRGYRKMGPPPQAAPASLTAVTWAQTDLALPASATRFIYVTDAGIVTVSATPGDSEDVIILGTVITSATTLDFLSLVDVDTVQSVSDLHRFLREAVGPIAVTGMIVTEHAAPSLQLAVDSGEFFVAKDRKESAVAAAPATFVYWYRSATPGVFVAVPGATAIDPSQYDDGSGALAAVPALQYKKDLVFAAPISDTAVEYHVVYGQELFSSQSAAEIGNIPTAPAVFITESLRLAGAIVQSGATDIASIVDLRPRLGQLAPPTTSVTDHGNLSGLFDDDHPQYQREVEKGAASGYASLDAGTKVPVAQLPDATTTAKGAVELATSGESAAGVVVQGNDSRLSDARTPTAHAASHLPSGSDPLTTAAANTLSVGSAASAGVAESFAKSDHNHAITAPGAPADVTKAAASAGVSTTPSRADHKHDVTTAAPAAAGLGTTSAEGVATTLARSDHTHQSNTAPANVTKAAAEIGTSTEPARADHKHDAATAAPGATGVATASGEGTSTSLARADHTHQSNTAPADVTKAAAVIGTSGEPARADHKHNISTAAASANPPGTASAEGAATSLARSDHTHALAAFGTASGTFCEGNDSRLTRKFQWKADELDSPVNSNWAVNALAPVVACSGNAALTCRRFDDTTEEGVGFMIFLPTGTSSFKIKIKSRAETAPGAARTVGVKLYKRGVPDNAAVEAWGSTVLTNIDIPTNAFYQYDEQTLTFATLSLTAGGLYQFELTRINPTAGTELVGDWTLLMIEVELS